MKSIGESISRITESKRVDSEPTILIPHEDLYRGTPEHGEGIAEEEIQPGMMIEIDAGKVSKLTKKNVVFLPTGKRPTFAVENMYSGESIHDKYCKGHQVLAVIPERKDRILTKISDRTTNIKNFEEEDDVLLCADGNGWLRELKENESHAIAKIVTIKGVGNADEEFMGETVRDFHEWNQKLKWAIVEIL